jgi:phage gpG-like protein
MEIEQCGNGSSSVAKGRAKAIYATSVTFMSLSYHDAITPAIQEALDLLGDCSPILEEFGAWQDGVTDDLFRNEIDPYGNPWADLKDSTWKQKRAKGSIDKKLQWRGDMRASVVSQVNGNNFLHGFTDKKARFHDRGTKKIPRRQLIPDSAKGLPKTSEKELAAIALKYLFRAFAGT